MDREDLRELVGCIDELLGPHRDAMKILGKGADPLFALDTGPFNSDRGMDGLPHMPAWRAGEPDASLAVCLRELLAQWNVETYDEGILRDEAILAMHDHEEGFSQSVYVLDESLIVIGLAQVLLEGGIDDDARPILSLAVARQRHPLVLEACWAADAIDARRKALDVVARVVANAPVPTQAARDGLLARLRKMERRDDPERAKRTPRRDPCPFPAGTVVARTLPSGTPVLLHVVRSYPSGHFKCELPVLVALAWTGDALPSPDVVRTLKPADDWAFTPIPDQGYSNTQRRGAYAKAMRATFRATGLTKDGYERNPTCNWSSRRSTRASATNTTPSTPLPDRRPVEVRPRRSRQSRSRTGARTSKFASCELRPDMRPHLASKFAPSDLRSSPPTGPAGPSARGRRQHGAARRVGRGSDGANFETASKGAPARRRAARVGSSRRVDAETAWARSR
jgi:hypothetical protein